MARLADHIGAIVQIASDECQRCSIDGTELDEWVSTLYILTAERWDEYDPSRSNPYTWIYRIIRPRLVDAMFRSVGFYRGMEGPRGQAVKCVRRAVQTECDVSIDGFASMPGLRAAIVPRPEDRARYKRAIERMRAKARKQNGKPGLHR